jgi:tetratricopeptide (TPR) repeat protein
MIRPFRVALPLLVLGAALPLHAQCPDGTPPPCRGAARPAARPVVAMDDRTWIVLPFDNQAHAAELDWLKDASVNLLYMDLSRWSDVRAVDDKRVADFLRELPAARVGRKLSMSDAQGVARRAGAGKLVMGEFLKLGARTRVSATAYDSRTGRTIRAVQEETAVLDSLLPLFGKVARGLLAVPPPAGSNVGTVGTSRVAAYQEYLAGVAALNRFDIEEAKRRLQRALSLDTAFALAHYKLAIVNVYDEAAQNERMMAQAAAGNLSGMAGAPDSGRIAHAAAAARLAGTLPARERGLINGLLAQTRQDYARACELYGALVRADSSDVEALYGVGECSYKDDAIEFVAGDSTQPRFRASWNTTLRVLRRALVVDPSYHLAFQHVLDVLTASARLGCRRDDPALPCGKGGWGYRASVRANGDSLLTLPLRMNYEQAILSQLGDATRSSTRRQNLEQARLAAEEWIAAGPREGRAHKTLARILLRQGRLEDADREMVEAAALLPHDDLSDEPMYRLEIALKRGKSGEVVRLYDSLWATQKLELFHASLAMMMGPLVGRVTSSDSALPTILRIQAKGAAPTVPAPLLRYFGEAARIALGVAGDSAISLERRLLGMTRSEKRCGDNCRLLLAPSWMFGLQLKRSLWPAFDSTATDRKLAPAAALAAGDTVRLRVAARMLDSATAEEAKRGLPEDGSTLIAADAFLVLRDTTAALRLVRRMLDTTLVVTSLETPMGGIGQTFAGTLWPRVMLLRADLAAAKADPELQPVVARVRKSLKSVNSEP